MSSSLSIATTGLTSSNKALDVIGNNLANANTIGYKSGETTFASMLSQSLMGGSGSMQVGQGVGVTAIQTSFSQGSFTTTGSATDCAIDGTGFFIVKSAQDDLVYYTRAGSFSLNDEGDLVDMSSYYVQGHIINSAGVEATAMSNINLTGRQSQPQESTVFKLGVNLNIDTEDTDNPNYFTGTQTIYDTAGSKHSLTTTFTRSTGVDRLWSISADIDSGTKIVPNNAWLEFNTDGELITATRRQIVAGNHLYSNSGATTDLTASTEWDSIYDSAGTAYGFATGETIIYTGADNSGTAFGGTYTIAAGSTIQDLLDHIEAKCTADGGTDVTAAIVNGRILLVDSVTGTSSMAIAFNSVTSTADVAAFGTLNTTNDLGQAGSASSVKEDIAFDFSGVSTSYGDAGVITWDTTSASAKDITSYAIDSRVSSVSNDGYPAGLLSSLDVTGDGIITGYFTNGQQQSLARVLTASFTSPNGLSKVGSYFQETADSGAPTVGNPGTGGLGAIQSSTLEASNADVASEFIKMISAQRAYQASSRIITTADQMLQELMNIKR